MSTSWFPGLVLVACFVAFFDGCGSSEPTVTLAADERFQKAKALFDEEEYLEAINEFTIVTLQFQGSEYADDAQFYLGECRFRRGEYLLAAYEYSTLKRNWPASALIPEAQYKLALSYYMLSPKPSLDQQYTIRAIDEFQTFVEYYPSNEHAVEAEEKIKELTVRLAKKQYDNAVIYQQMEAYKSALAYYDDVIERFHDTEYALLAYLGKADVLMERKKYEEARLVVNAFLEKFPNSVLRSRAEELKRKIDARIQSVPPVTGGGSGQRERRAGEESASSRTGQQ